jgi:hypothetical protein
MSRKWTTEYSRRELRRSLVRHFSEDELRTLAFDLDIDYECLPAEGKTGKARELLLSLERTGRIPEFVEMLSQLRPDVL